MRGAIHSLFPLLLIAARCALAQPVPIVHQDEHLASDRPEAWGMSYFAASTFMTAFGELPALAPGHWALEAELGLIPHLSDSEQQIGLRGLKKEDLNRSPVFGRLRGRVGLPAGWIAELGYTPPLEIDGTRPRDLVSAAFGRTFVERERWTLGARIFGQHGRIEGDITCAARLAGVPDRNENPSGCQAPSDDRVDLNYYGADVVTGWAAGKWRMYADIGAVRSELAVQADALLPNLRDRSRLTARSVLSYAALGATYPLDARWSVGGEFLYVPLTVKREAGGPRTYDPLATVRVELRYRFD